MDCTMLNQTKARWDVEDTRARAATGYSPRLGRSEQGARPVKMLRRMQCAAVGITVGCGVDDRLVEAHMVATRMGATVGGAATRVRPWTVGVKVFQVCIRIMVRTGMGLPGITRGE